MDIRFNMQVQVIFNENIIILCSSKIDYVRHLIVHAPKKISHAMATAKNASPSQGKESNAVLRQGINNYLF